MSGAVEQSGGNLKKRMRDVERFLRRPNLPGNIRQEQERKLRHLQIQQEEAQRAEKTRALAMRYRKVRFFESVKATRHLKQAVKALLSTPSEETKKQYLEAKANEVYVLCFPQNEKYISLFPSTPLKEAAVLEMRANKRSDLAREHGIQLESMTLEEAMAIARSDEVSLKKQPAAKSEKSGTDSEEADYVKDGEDSDDEDEDDEDDDDGEDDDDEDDDDGDEEDFSDDEEDFSDAEAGGNEGEGNEKAPESNSDDDDDDDEEGDDEDDDDDDDDDEEEEEEYDEDDDEDDEEDTKPVASKKGRY